ncbi:hypothetical protein ANCDUO_15543 [Ancylostoma duodenale]|uniref:Uncharacterized protein n=1 Tax=Ancylostoma duodenale TaxID=51022 RepID=A0A0C2G0A4_9BILA|nr:hypothetical protein ANCDUO_15543 [Ancylostoma duodenale]
MVPPPVDHPSVLHNPTDYTIPQSRYGLGDYGSAFNAVQPRASSAYEQYDLGQASAPAPAPAPRGGSAGPGRYGYPSTSGRRTLTRQHRSMDTMGPLETDMGVGSHDGPLAIATNFPLHQVSLMFV